MPVLYKKSEWKEKLQREASGASGQQHTASRKTLAEAGLLTAHERIEKLAAREMAADPHLSAERARTKVLLARPDLYEAYLEQHPEQTGLK